MSKYEYDPTDPLVGGTVSDEEQAMYAERVARIEADDITSGSHGPAYEGDEGDEGDDSPTALLESIIGADALDRAIGPGRPNLDGAIGKGVSRPRSLRLGSELDALLDARVNSTNDDASTIIRRALREYLQHAS